MPATTTDTGTTTRVPKEEFFCFAICKTGERCQHKPERFERFCTVHRSWKPFVKKERQKRQTAMSESLTLRQLDSMTEVDLDALILKFRQGKIGGGQQ